MQGLLDLEGNPASVLVHLVKRDQAATNMLDTSTGAQDAMNRYVRSYLGIPVFLGGRGVNFNTWIIYS